MRIDPRPRELLIKYVKAHGLDICHDAYRFRKFLEARCPDSEKEIDALVAVVFSGVLDQLPPKCLLRGAEPVLDEYAQQIEKISGLRRGLLRWALDSWVLAMGAVPSDDIADAVSGIQQPSASSSMTALGNPTAGITRSALDVVRGRSSAEDASSSGSGQGNSSETDNGCGCCGCFVLIVAAFLVFGILGLFSVF